MKRALSISLGSSRRDKTASLELGGEVVAIERRGTNGDAARARRLFRDLDGSVDAFGLGGFELTLRLDDRSYPLRAGRAIVRDVRNTPVVDGCGLRWVLERRVFDLVADVLGEKPRFASAFVTVGADRWGMSLAVAEVTDRVVFGDLMFALGLPIPLRSLAALRRVARMLLPIVRWLPAWLLYPIGKDQEEIRPRYPEHFAAAELVAGDFHYLRRHMPDDLAGKVIVTNTTTDDDVELLRSRGARMLITTTPRLGGRSFGTNVIEAALTAQAGHGRALTDDELLEAITRFRLGPSVVTLNA